MTENKPVIETNYGPVRGLKRTSVVGDQFFSFRGIPYAKPPTGEFRFKDPQPADSWNQPLNCFESGHPAPCLNFMTQTVTGNENCLTLNVYTKELSPRKPLPVMVWIHGGAFKYGDSSEMMYSPDYLLANDIVFVSMNYRLGILGFLSIADPSVQIPGNAGLKDQRLALKWVRENVQYFGGDAGNVTIFGESAGGASVHWHMLSDFSKDLFDKAIVMSGSAMAPWAHSPPGNSIEHIAKSLGWDGVGGSTKLVEFLRSLDAAYLVESQDIRIDGNKKEWGPSLEPYVSDQSFFTTSPLETFRSAWGNKIPLIIGGTSDEGLLFYREIAAKADLLEDDRVFENLVPKTWNLSIEKINEFSKMLKEVYDTDCRDSNVANILKIMGDLHFWYGLHLAIAGRLKNVDSAKTYLYRFSFAGDPKLNRVRQLLVPNDVKGVCHGEDLACLFKNAMGKEPNVNSAEHKTINRMARLVTRFAATGNPNCELNRTVLWKDLENRSSPPYKCLNIDEELSFIFYPEAKRMALWDNFFDTTPYSLKRT